MATALFPASPTDGNRYTFGARVWQYGNGGWQAVQNAGQTTTAFNSVEIVQDPSSPPLPFLTPTLINYV